MAVSVGSLESFEPRARLFTDSHCIDDGNDEENLASSTLKPTTKLASSAAFNSNKSSFSHSQWSRQKADECWVIRKVECGEEELYAKGKFVYWTKGAGPMTVMLKTFNFSENVLRTFWCKFAKKDHICVVVPSGLHIFNQFGHHYQVPLPFSFDQLYPTKLGLIIERDPDPESDPTLPVLFALLHPTYEVSPILMKTSFKCTPNQQQQQQQQQQPQQQFNRHEQHQNNKTSSFLLPNILTIVACHEHLPLCLMYNLQESNHSIWRIRHTSPEEIEEFNKINNDSTINTLPNQASFKDSISTHTSNNHTPSFNLSGRIKPGLLLPHSPSTNFSPKMELRSRHSMLGSLAASRLGSGGQLTQDNITPSNLLSFESPSTLKIMSTPNRNNFLNYLRDDIEEPIVPELAFEQIWTESAAIPSKAEKFFSTFDFVGSEYIIIVAPISKTIKIVRYEITNDNDNLAMGHTKIIEAIDALPIYTLKMMIVLESNKTLSLYSGFNKVTDIAITQFDPVAYSRQVPEQSIAMTPVQMSSARKRTSFGEKSWDDHSIQNMFHAISPVPHALHSKTKEYNIISNDISSLDFAVGHSVIISDYKKQYARFNVPSLSMTSTVSRLIDSMKSLVSRDLGLSLISKWYAARRSTGKQNFMTAQQELRLFKNWFLGCLGVSGNYFEDSTICKTSSSPIECVFVSPHKRSKKMRDTGDNPILSNIYPLFYAMHLVYEDFKLNTSNWDKAYEIAELLLVLSCMLKQTSYQEYYWQNFPDLQSRYSKHKSKLQALFPKVSEFYRPAFFREDPPSVYNFIYKIVKIYQSKNDYINITNQDTETLFSYPLVMDITNDVKTIIALFCEMFGIDSNNALTAINPVGTPAQHEFTINYDRICRSRSNDAKIVTMLAEMNRTRDYLQTLPQGLALFIWDSILNCRDAPPTNWPEACYSLVGRMDLVSLVGHGQSIESVFNLPPPKTVIAAETKSKSASSNTKQSKATYRQHNDDEVGRLLFPDDQRVNDAHKMLASDIAVEFNVVQRQDITDEESREDADKHLYLLNIRTMAMPIGRGAINLRTYSPVIGESFNVPKLNLSGWNQSGDSVMEYTHDMSVYPWPHFHNGVAAGLTICASTSSNIIDSTWINYNRPKSNVMHGTGVRDREVTIASVNNEHAGFLFALGLNGHLAKLSQMTIHDYLCQSNDLTRVAILLGLSAAKRGSCDTNMIKVLSIHIDALLPPTSTELDVPATVQIASILGVGLLYQGSCDSHISKVLLDEIGRLPGQESNSQQDRESYSMSAGLSFGLVNLCKGSSRAKVAATSTISASDQLRQYMLGGKRKQLTTAQKQRYLKQDCHRGEADFINPHVTSAGGTLALGLMYHKSENKSVANWMLAPDTQSLLEYVRPDSLVLRMISYGLIMWNDVEPTEDWINSHIPEIVSKHAFQRSTKYSSDGSSTLLGTSGAPIDYETMGQAYCNIVAGCCMAIALRFAGSSNKYAFKTIYKHTKMFIQLSIKSTLADLAGRSTIESCLNVLVTSLALVMAGTGDLEVLRVCRYIRSRLMHNSIFYGSYMAVHMALGLLFLGGCRYSFSTSPESISALVCALYPMYPNHSSDNRYHLQALRHLYVLASEPRLLIPRDIRSRKPTYVWISLKQKLDHRYKLQALGRLQKDEAKAIKTDYMEADVNNDKEDCKQLEDEEGKGNGGEGKLRNKDEKNEEIIVHRLRAPCLVPEVDSVISVCVDDERYWRVEIDNKTSLAKCLFQEGGCINVKQKAKYLPINEGYGDSNNEHVSTTKPGELPSVSSQDCVTIDWASNYSLLQQSGDQLVKDLSNLMLQEMVLGDTHSRLTSILVQCVKKDRIETMSPLYSLLVRSGELTRKDNFSKLVLQQLKIAYRLSEQSGNKMNLFRPILNLLNTSDELKNFAAYASGKTDWTDTKESVVDYMILHDMMILGNAMPEIDGSLFDE